MNVKDSLLLQRVSVLIPVRSPTGSFPPPPRRRAANRRTSIIIGAEPAADSLSDHRFIRYTGERFNVPCVVVAEPRQHRRPSTARSTGTMQSKSEWLHQLPIRQQQQQRTLLHHQQLTPSRNTAADGAWCVCRVRMDRRRGGSGLSRLLRSRSSSSGDLYGYDDGRMTSSSGVLGSMTYRQSTFVVCLLSTVSNQRYITTSCELISHLQITSSRCEIGEVALSE